MRTKVASIVYFTSRRLVRVRKNCIFVEWQNAEDHLGDVYYIARKLANTTKYERLKLIVSCNTKSRETLKAFTKTRRVTVCKVNTIKYCFWLSIAEYLFSEGCLPIFFSRRREQKYINLFRKQPDIPVGGRHAPDPFQLSSLQRNFLHATHLLGADSSGKMTLLDEYMLRGVWQGSILCGKVGTNVEEGAENRDNGEALAENICEYFFSGEKTCDETKIAPDTEKLQILIYGGSFPVNGITASLKNLLAEIDKERYNFFLYVDKSEELFHTKDYFRTLDERIGYIPVEHHIAADVTDAVKLFLSRIFPSIFRKLSYMTHLWVTEYTRRFGAAKFDIFIHYTGYNRNAAVMMMASNSRKIIYMHNDMVREYELKNNYHKTTIDKAYCEADVIVTVRKGLEKEYSNSVQDISKKVIHVPNVLRSDYRQLAHDDVGEVLSKDTPKTILEKMTILLAEKQSFRFINLARFSAEKGQLRLIEAFEKVWESNNTCQLYILGGYGELYGEIAERVEHSNATNSIVVAKGSSNPFPLLSRMDTFVLASYYEGLPMAIFECLALNIPIITTNIPGPSDFLLKGYGMVVDNSVQGLVEGMTCAIGRGVKAKTFDFYTYNKDALDKFYALLEPRRNV